MTLLLSVAYLASMAVAAGVGVYVLRGSRLTLSGLAVGTVLVATIIWSVIAFVGTHEEFTAGSDAPVRALFWSAVLVAGIRSLARVLEEPSWSPRPADIVNLIAHPWALGLIAAFPVFHQFVVVADDDGTLSYTYGFWIHSGVGLLLSLGPLAALISARSRISQVARNTRLLMVAAWLLPAAGYVFSALVWGPSGPNLAPALMVLPVIMIGSAVVRDGLIDKVPLARGEIFESLAGAVFVTDNWGRVIDVNAAARAFVKEVDGAEDVVGSPLDETCPRTAQILDQAGEVDVQGLGQARVVNLVKTAVSDGRGTTVGRCVIVRDVTESVLQRRELERTRDALSRQVEVSEKLRVELSDQVIRDSATGLYNRRFLAEALPVIVAACLDKEAPLSVAVIDIDDFKAVNDSWGHAVGDRVIEAVAEALAANAPGARAVRYGGDEFLVLLPELAAAEALAAAESLRLACSAVVVDTRDGPVQVTVSAGVATLRAEEIDAQELLEVADLALYRAKNAGRNRTWSQADGAA
ncbi:diguanylate cyclase [Demequina sp. TTPB684]|uniref:GGDEF domain-containing protein n=1 Tax=unclassified Demequina TaxID=2620311 RepID=UPI001CF5442D|nr:MULTISPECIES: GGDEF domain-containing protein [unclassified Demequina]MCB2412065.1 diguanylate cyclase [Demequina sp. TTPB684]UPU88519.1 diguanylate cyclase [Demequina sp. TMPB413]